MTLRGLLFFFMIGIVFFAAGCSDSPTEVNNYYYLSADSLSNPNIKPKVIFTSPANGAVGPFENLDPTNSLEQPKITIQFNKLVNIYDVSSDDIFLQYGEHRVPLLLINRNGDNNSNFLTNILIFKLREFYKVKKTYKLVVNKSLKDVHRYNLEPYEISFLPEPEFRIIHVFPTTEDVEPAGIDQNGYYKIRIKFNSKINSAISKYLTIEPNINGVWLLKDDSITVDFYPKGIIKHNTQYTISISGEAQDSYGNKIKSPYSFSFKTAPFKVECRGYISYTGSDGFLIFNNFSFRFNEPVDTTSVRQSLTVSPAIDFYVRYLSSTDDHIQHLKINLESSQMKPNTVYSIKFDTSLRSIYGDHLLKPYVFSFRTGVK